MASKKNRTKAKERDRVAAFTGVRRREAGSYEAVFQGKHSATFTTAAEAGGAVDAAEAQISPALQVYLDEIRATVA